MAITKVSQHLLADDLVLPGNPTVATQSASDNSTKIATTAYVTTAVSNLVDGAPSTLNTLNEIAAALGDDAALNTTLTNSIAAKLPLAGGTLTGNIAHASNFTIDVGGILNLDADNGGNINFKDGGTHYATHQNENGDYRIISNAEDKDIIFRGNDGSTYINALTLDMSEAGAATFNSSIASGQITITQTHPTVFLQTSGGGATDAAYLQKYNNDLYLYNKESAGSLFLGTNNVTKLTVDSAGDVGIGVTPYTNAKLTLGGSDSQGYSSVLMFDNNHTSGAEFFMLATDAAWSAGAGKFIMGHGAPSSNNADITIDADGKLGIRTSSPAAYLHVAGSSGSMILNESTDWSYLRLKSPNANGGYIQFADADDDDVGQIFYYHGSGGDYMSFTTNANERMRIDASGRLLINTAGSYTTTPAFGTGSGHAFHVGDSSHISHNDGVALMVNRGSGAGGVLGIRLAGSAIGELGTEGGDSLYIQGKAGASGGSGLLFHGTAAKILPIQNGASVNDTVDLGQDTRRFKDLWISGNITLAGTVAASTNITSTGIITANHIIRSDAGHNTARFEAVYDDQNSTYPQYDGNMLMWVSEPGVSYDSGGVGTNVHPSGPYYGRKYNYGYSSYMRFQKADGNIVFYNNQGTAGSANASQTEMMRIEQAGNIRLAANAGIGFGSTAAQHLLDDYEEGTWTPVIHSSGGAVSAGYGYRSGYYIKMGNAVYVRFGFRLTSRSGGGGTAEITGLPFTSKNYGGYQQPACTVNSQSLTTNPGGFVLYYTVDNNTKLQGRLMGNNGDVVLPISYYQNTSWCIGNFIYDVA